VKEGQRGVCGATKETVAARNFIRMIAAGAASHSDHGRDMALTLLAVAEGEAPDYEIRDEKKLLEVAHLLGIKTKNRETLEIAKSVAETALAQFGDGPGPIRAAERGGTLPWQSAQEETRYLARPAHCPSRD